MPYVIQYLLGLQGLIVHLVLHHFSEVHLVVSVRRKTGTCPSCGKRSRFIHGYRPPQYVKHILVGGRQLYLVIHKRRFYCQRCSRAFVEEVSGLTKWGRHTNQLAEEVILKNKRGLPRKLLLKGKEHLSEEERYKLKLLLTNYPDLQTYYFIKEGLREMYAKQTKEEATKLLDNLISMMYRQREKGCSDWARTLERYRVGILNYFDFHITNAYTEGVHTKMKLIKRQGFGYRNKQIYMRKLVLGFLPLAAAITPHLFQ